MTLLQATIVFIRHRFSTMRNVHSIGFGIKRVRNLSSETVETANNQEMNSASKGQTLFQKEHPSAQSEIRSKISSEFDTERELASELARLLAEQNKKIVLAESCTGGMAAALLTQVPGISQYFCGSAVTYREATKSQWLKVSPEHMHEFTAESMEASDEMAVNILEMTEEADFSAAITGHLGPGIDPKIDGILFISLAIKQPAKSHCKVIHRFSGGLSASDRIQRQLESAAIMLEQCIMHLMENDRTN